MKGRDVKTTVEILKLLTHHGADVDLRRNNGEVALHTAARRGPVQAVWVLLLCKATHDVVDQHMFTPEGAAVRAGNKDFVAILANWPIVRVKYFDSEFVQEWMKFICDPDANLDRNLTAGEILTYMRMEDHEESTAVRARGGHLLIDEIITGPVLSAEDRAKVQIFPLSTDSVSVTSAVGSSTDASDGAAYGEHEQNENVERGGVGEQGNENNTDVRKKKTKSKLGKEIGVFLAQARDENAGVIVDTVGGETSAYSRLVTRAQLEGRKARWPGPRNNGKGPTAEGKGKPADPFGRSMTTSQRRRIAALEIAEDGGGMRHYVRCLFFWFFWFLFVVSQGHVYPLSFCCCCWRRMAAVETAEDGGGMRHYVRCFFVFRVSGSCLPPFFFFF